MLTPDLVPVAHVLMTLGISIPVIAICSAPSRWVPYCLISGVILFSAGVVCLVAVV